MKHDKDKPQAIKFYWDGLALIMQDTSPLILAFQQFAKNKSLDDLRTFFNAVRLDIRRMPDSEDVPSQVLLVYDHGAQLYGDKNYLGLGLERIIHAMGRHLVGMCLGNPIDQSGYHHRAHIMANILIASELLEKRN